MTNLKLPRRKFLHLAAGAAALSIVCFLMSHGASSQTPRTIKIVFPGAPGSGGDAMVRLLAEQIGRTQGLTIMVENRPGANQVIGTEAVSRAAPDGNTLLSITSAFVTAPHLRKLGYDPRTSFEPICFLMSAPGVIVVNSSSPYRTLGDLLNAARAKPGDLTLASVGPAGVLHISFEILKRAANIDITFVPFQGMALAVNALLGEHVTMVFADYPTVAEQLKTGRLRALATASLKRVEALPDVPTVAESGYKDYEADLWYGIVAPAKTPREMVSQLAGWFTTALQVPEIKAKLAVQGLIPAAMCGADFGALIRKQYDSFGRAIREANIKAE
jgi:tripartite-type tricarboxylate transporter receptor subunit TctC